MTDPRREDLDEEARPATEQDEGLGEEDNSLPEDRTPSGPGEEA
ncbi:MULTISPECIES: hypothetical protein [Amycolatopsis]|uniref:Uncharacterized protein n=3 Tax=Amycolatopsis TaxID=1813 RepID=A0A076MX57_AMYME|nr:MULTISPECIES: hypothetical protein [Amycolatopsis]AIJ22282.1 hypothetical protein AMETH_2190 [Amycolatopsis methanolica 239]ROS38845.1 hypothetical protein EDD35_1133 [Amycolatopsis thermoflava]